jgi:phage terminase large subunit
MATADAVVSAVVIPYRPRALQLAIHDALERSRFGVAVCHRRFGKTVLAVNHLQKHALTCPRSRPRLAYLAPTYRQGKAVAWDYMKHYAAPIPGHDVNESELRIDYPNGGQVRIYGADNPDALRGIYLDGVVLDEYGLMAPEVFGEVVRPLLTDREGWALFIGTPNGKNQFYDVVQQAKADPTWFFAEYKASQTQLLPMPELESARQSMTADEYAQEFECSFEASVKGAVFAREVLAARADGRITRVPYDPALRVNTDWDLGVGDATAIWFSQSSPSGEIRLIDYYEATGQGLPHYVDVITRKPYVYGAHFAPHDIQVRELGSGHSRWDIASGLGLHFQIVPRIEQLEDGIHAARVLFGRCWFDGEKAARGIEALQHYHWDFNQRIHEFKPVPVHDWASHGADAFRQLAYRHFTPKHQPERIAAAALRQAQKDTDPYDLRQRAHKAGRGGY